MWVIGFMAICGGSLFIMAGIVYLREKHWGKHNKRLRHKQTSSA